MLIEGVPGVPDGIRASEEGNLYVAANAILVYSPEGKLLNTYTLPEKPSNCAFGDGDLQSLYVTARTALYRIRLDVKGSLQYLKRDQGVARRRGRLPYSDLSASTGSTRSARRTGA